MATDRRLAPNFWLREFPCYWEASELDVSRLLETVTEVLQPVRDRWGKTVPTSWKWWRSGCSLRTGAHGQGGTVDFVVPGTGDLQDVWEWGITELMPRGYIGRWIYTPPDPGPEHIHVAPRTDMLLAHGDDRPMALVQVEEGDYRSERIPTLRAGPGAWGGLFMLALLAASYTATQ